MDYSLENIYAGVGRDDKVATINFIPGTESYNAFGEDITCVLIYTQKERHSLDKNIEEEIYTSHGKVKARILDLDFPEKETKLLLTEGFNSRDIQCILVSNWNIGPKNTYHSTETRSIDTIIIPIESLPKGGDLSWMYGFKKRWVIDGVGLNPQERAFYLAGKIFFEPKNLSDTEKKEAYPNGTISSEVEYELLKIKLITEVALHEEKVRLLKIDQSKTKENAELLNKYLVENGSSLKKLTRDNQDAMIELMMRLDKFKDIRLSISGKKAIYLDMDRYLHILLRHVKEAKVNEKFEHKDNFQWKEEDVFMVVLKHVVEDIDDEIQQHFLDNPDKRYSRYGDENIYYQGDYYTIHIEPTGRVSTFHKNKKVICNNRGEKTNLTSPPVVG